jgi:uncharacterized protein with ATP-grasp and redox domains
VRSALDCIPCFARQALDAARMASDDPAIHEDIVREILPWIAEADLSQSPPRFAQHIHRRLRALTATADPHHEAKARHNQMALSLLAELKTEIARAPRPLETAVRLAIAGNVIDMGAKTDVTDWDLRQAIAQALSQPVTGDCEDFCRAADTAGSILYLTDNAGEIAFDRLLIEQLGPHRVTVAVRGAPVINDATLADASVVGLDEIATVIDNGSDAPGTILADCSPEFQRRYADSDLVIAKGQGNFESLSDESRDVFFLFKVKCQVVADHVGAPPGTHLLKRSRSCSTTDGERT